MAKPASHSGTSTLELITFGVPGVRVGGENPPPEVAWRKNIALLTYLALSPNQTRSRAQIIGLLWPDTTDQRARHSLNEAVRRLRASLGAERLQSTGAGENLTLSADGLRVDALEFDRLEDEDNSAALQMVRGEFLEGFALEDSQEFDAWVQGRREHYDTRAMQLRILVGEEALTESLHEQAAEHARRALQARPFAEPAANLLMRALTLAGDSAGALAAYSDFCGGLKRELGENASYDLQNLADRIRSRRWLRASARYADVDPPFLNRGSASRTAFSIVARATEAGPQGLAIVGDPGSGRTRMLAECAARFALRGGVVAAGRLLESDHDAPWSALRALARGGLTEAPGVAATSPRHLAVLASMVPGITSAAPPVAPRDAAEVAAALAELIRAVAEEQPLLLAIDDAHFADPATIEALHGAMLQLQEAPVLLVLTTTPDVEEASHALVRLRGEIGRGVAGSAIRLTPFTPADVERLVEALATWCENDEERDRLARRVSFDTGGNPFLAVTLLRGLDKAVTLRDDLKSWPQRNTTLDSPLPISVPELARMAIVASLTAMKRSARDVVAAASVLNMGVDVDLLVHLLDGSVPDVEEELAALERARLITFDGRRYAFAAPLIAQVVRAELLTPGQRRGLLERAVEVLSGRDDLEGRLLRVQLLAETDPGRPTAEEAGTVARAAHAAGAVRTAKRAVAAAARAVRRGSEDDATFVSALRSEVAAAES